MKGSNELILCQASLKEALEYWLQHTQLREGLQVRVDQVKQQDNIAGCLSVTVVLKEVEDD